MLLASHNSLHIIDLLATMIFKNIFVLPTTATGDNIFNVVDKVLKKA